METNIRRTYLATEELVAKIHASYELKYVEKFYDFVYDTNELQLIKAGYLLLLRVSKNDECHWRLRKSTENIAESPDTIINRVSELTKGTGTYITDFAPCILASIRTTRMRFSDKLWIDFSSWVRGETSGLYATITCFEDLSDAVMAQESIVPSRYYVCMKDICPNAFKSVFRLNCSHIDANIIRDPNHTFSLSYHRLKTYNDALDESEDDSVDDFDDDFLWLSSTTNYDYEKNKKAMEENLQKNETDPYYYMKWNRFDESEDDSEDEATKIMLSGEY